MLPLAPLAAIFGRIPPKVWVIGAVLALLAYYRWDARSAKAEFKRAQEQAQLEHAAQVVRDATETQRRTKAIMEVADAATLQSQTDRADSDRLRAADQRLRARLAAYQANGGSANPAAAAGGQAASAPTGVPADVFGRCLDRVRLVAGYADTTRTAGEACERSYDALSELP